MTEPTYGTEEELEAYIADDQLLTRASRLIDSVLVGTFYAVDTDGFATDPKIKNAINKATLAQVAYWRSGYGSQFGPPQYQEMAIGSVKLVTSQKGNVKKSDVAPQALYELQHAGLLPITPWTVG